MKHASLAEIAQALRSHDRFLILSHVRPDGDAIGSQVALAESLRALGKTVHLVNQDGLPSNLAFLQGAETLSSPPSHALDVEVVIALDTANYPRLGEQAIQAGALAKLWITIDHHKTNPGYGDLVHIDSTAPATGQIIYQLLIENDFPIPDASRDAIYVAVSTDTGSFQYPSTTARTYEMAADLLRRGLDVGGINRLTYNNFPYRRIELLRSLLNTLERCAENRVAHWELTLATKDALHLLPEDSEEMIDHIRAIEGVIVALFFEELRGGEIRVSMRSKDPRVDASEICGQFGGGGHSLAAGIRMDGPLAEAKSKVLAAVSAKALAL